MGVKCLHLLDASDLKILCLQVFVPTSDDEMAAWEATLAESVIDLPSFADAQDTPLVASAGGIPTATFVQDGVAFIVSMETEEDDEIEAQLSCEFFARLVEGVCDKSLSPSKVTSFAGKIITVLDEAVEDGVILHEHVDSHLRGAKLKLPQTL